MYFYLCGNCFVYKKLHEQTNLPTRGGGKRTWEL